MSQLFTNDPLVDWRGNFIASFLQPLPSCLTG